MSPVNVSFSSLPIFDFSPAWVWPYHFFVMHMHVFLWFWEWWCDDWIGVTSTCGMTKRTIYLSNILMVNTTCLCVIQWKYQTRNWHSLNSGPRCVAARKSKVVECTGNWCCWCMWHLHWLTCFPDTTGNLLYSWSSTCRHSINCLQTPQYCMKNKSSRKLWKAEKETERMNCSLYAWLEAGWGKNRIGATGIKRVALELRR